MEFTHTQILPAARIPRVATFAHRGARTMSISVDSTTTQITAALQNENDSYLTSGYYDRTAKKVKHFNNLRDLNAVRLAKGMQFLRSTDVDIIADKLNLISDIHAISDDEFSRVNLCPILNQLDAPAEISNDIKELESIQTLYTLFGV